MIHEIESQTKYYNLEGEGVRVSTATMTRFVLAKGLTKWQEYLNDSEKNHKNNSVLYLQTKYRKHFFAFHSRAQLPWRVSS